MSSLLRPIKEHARTGDPVWLFVAYRDGQYIGWSEAEDKDVREVLKISADDELPMVSVRRFNNPMAAEYRRKRGRRFRQIGKDLPPEVQDRIVLESVAHAVLADWKRVAVDGDEPTPYTPEAAITFFEQDPDFYELIVALSTKEEHHRTQAVKEDAEVLGEA